MPDGAPARSDIGDAADERARVTDSRLIRGVRLRPRLWRGLSTMLVLLVLGAALYLVVAGNLEKNGNDQLAARTAEFARRPFGPGQGFSFGGGSSGTSALIANDAGRQVGPGAPFIPDQLPLAPAID